jgi:hypothetical protein
VGDGRLIPGGAVDSRRRVPLHSCLFVMALFAFLVASPAAASATALPEKITENTTLTAEKSPYEGGSLTISSAAILHIEPGVIVRLTGTLYVNGTLDASGTEASPVVLTSKSDSAPRQWFGVRFEAESGASTMRHVELRYARTGIQINSCSPSITDSWIHSNSELGISASAGSPQIVGDMISNNGNAGVSLTFPEGHPGSVDFDENLVEGNKADGLDVSALTAYTKIESADLGNNSFVNNTARAIDYDAYATTSPSYYSNPIPPNITTNTLSGNGQNGIWLSGKVKQSTTWENHGYAIVAMNEPLIVGEGNTLTLGAGTVIKSSGPGGGMKVLGTLLPEGNEGEAVTFTSLKDDSVDGDTNGDGSATSPGTGDWGEIRFPNANGVELAYLDVRYAKVALNIEYLGAMTVSRSDFSYNKAAFEVQKTAPNDPELAALPCVPPWLSHVFAVEDWFGAIGYPAPSIDITSVVGNVIPEGFSSLFSLLTAAGEVSAPLYPGDNTIPFAIYSCGATTPPIPPIPVTPVVLVNSPPVTGPWFDSPEAIWP